MRARAWPVDCRAAAVHPGERRTQNDHLRAALSPDDQEAGSGRCTRNRAFNARGSRGRPNAIRSQRPAHRPLNSVLRNKRMEDEKITLLDHHLVPMERLVKKLLA